jgi:pimeloyl-ACP methyl ester carboxylesterase
LSTQIRDPGAGLGTVKQVDAGLLNVGYAEVGPATGSPVILLHGCPYDIHSYEQVAPLLGSAGYRVIAPFLRGYGTTTFKSTETFRNGQQSVFAADAVALMDALDIPKAIVAGFDWELGRLTSWPRGGLHDAKGSCPVSGYLVVNLEANQQPLPPAAELGWWYQYYFATERVRRGYSQNRHDFNKLIWQLASPKWKFGDATYDRSAAAFDNPDHVDIVIHNYRWRLSLAEGESRYDALENKLLERPIIEVPAITIASDFDGAAIDGKAYRDRFSGRYSHKILEGIGHNVPQEAPQALADAVMGVDRY